jgi:hypothetical protein
MMMQTRLLDWQIRFEQLDNGGDPLIKLEEVVDWKLSERVTHLKGTCQEKKYPMSKEKHTFSTSVSFERGFL